MSTTYGKFGSLQLTVVTTPFLNRCKINYMKITRQTEVDWVGEYRFLDFCVGAIISADSVSEAGLHDDMYPLKAELITLRKKASR